MNAIVTVSPLLNVAALFRLTLSTLKRLLSRPLYRLFALMCLLCSVQAIAAAEPVGMVLDVQGGKAQQVAGIVTRPLQMLAYLNEDDVLRLEAGVKVSFSLYKERKVFNVLGPAELKIKLDTVQVLSGAEPAVKSMTNQMVAAQAGSRMLKGATKMRSIKPLIEVASPRNESLQLSGAIRFTWRTLEPMAVLVEVRRSDSTPIFSQVVEANVNMLAAPASLPPGSYLWNVSAAPGSTQESMPVAANFRVAELAQAREIRALAPAAGATLEERMLYLSYLLSMNVTDDALALWDDILKERPDLKTMKLPLPQ